MSHPIIQAALESGQSIWLDFISRELIESGGLEQAVAEGIRGVTSNPTIFEKAVSKGSDYDADIQAGVKHNASAQEIFESLAVCDVARAADTLAGVYASSEGRDGFVSLEVSPDLAHDTEGTIKEAEHLWRLVSRPNLMIKVPGTKAGMPAFQALIRKGINVNVTLLFSLEQYKSVLATYMSGLEDRLADGQGISDIASVASFFVSRVDTVADKQLREKGKEKLTGKAAIANACLAYRHFLEESETDRWQTLLHRGAQVQRPLWASTSTKDPALNDILYVDELIAKDTVNTIPPSTLEAFKDHGRPSEKLLVNLKQADATLKAIADAGIDLNRITTDLIEDGVKKFAVSYSELLQAIDAKIKLIAK
ncbi:transaldolase [bacterium]|nr:transaldolase [bacterium]MBU1636844.1 transaldolase [bacterium]MBU1919625.1 transaldolase [bacterium]